MDKSRLKQLLHPNWVSNVENFSIHCTTTNGFSSPTIFNFVTILFVRLLSMHMDFALFSAADTSIDGWHNGIKKNIFRILIQFVDVKERDQEKIIRKNRKRNTQINAFNEPFLCAHRSHWFSSIKSICVENGHSEQIALSSCLYWHWRKCEESKNDDRKKLCDEKSTHKKHRIIISHLSEFNKHATEWFRISESERLLVELGILNCNARARTHTHTFNCRICLEDFVPQMNANAIHSVLFSLAMIEKD